MSYLAKTGDIFDALYVGDAPDVWEVEAGDAAIAPAMNRTGFSFLLLLAKVTGSKWR